MAEPTVRLLAAEQRILAALAAGPLTTREVADRLRREVWETWAQENGYEIEWETPREPLGARLLAHATAAERGLVPLQTHEVYPRLVALERRGLVERVQILGHRPMLWKLAANAGSHAAQDTTP